MSTVAQRSGDISSLFFCLETKEPKIQGSGFLGYKSLATAKRFKLAALRQEIFLRRCSRFASRHKAEGRSCTLARASGSSMWLAETLPIPYRLQHSGVETSPFLF
jgi:hypothetical protein